ncbi:MAG TPA: hypothetical protein VFB60_24770 [Ktedonobacteraceae bacterium]|nr:hypothetical protein [Ktedonobacteraceae bacterium]
MTSPTITDNPGADAMICAASLARHSRAFPFSSPPDSCCLGSRPQRGAGQGERGAGNAASRRCRHLSPLASRAKLCEHDENGKALRAVMDRLKHTGHIWYDREHLVITNKAFLAADLSAARRDSSPIHRGSVGRLDNKAYHKFTGGASHGRRKSTGAGGKATAERG